jgi:vacuolar-type H+-ATPase subunit E/Vma4
MTEKHNQIGDTIEKTIQDLKREVQTIKKTQSETTLEMEILGKKSGTIHASISNRMKKIEERISGAEDSIENTHNNKKNAKCKKILTQDIQEIQDTMRRPNLRIVGVDKNKDFQFERPANIFNKIIEENLSNLKRDAHEHTRGIQKSK